MFRYESGDIEKLPADSLGPIAAALNTSIEFLMGWSDDSSPKPFPTLSPALSDKEQHVICLYWNAPRRGRRWRRPHHSLPPFDVGNDSAE